MSFDFVAAKTEIETREKSAKDAVRNAIDELYNSLSDYKERANDFHCVVDVTSTDVILSKLRNKILITPVAGPSEYPVYKVRRTTTDQGAREDEVGTFDRHALQEHVARFLLER